MNPSHVIATGGITGMLAGALVYLTHWPLQPLTDAQAANFAGLIVAGVGLLMTMRRSRQNLTGDGIGGAPSSADPAAKS